MITVARENEKTARLRVIPKKVKEDDNPALATRLSYTGTPEELDAERGRHLVRYVECHTQLASTLAQAKAEMETGFRGGSMRGFRGGGMMGGFHGGFGGRR